MGRMKDGNKKVRWILIEAANTASRTDDRLRKFYISQKAWTPHCNNTCCKLDVHYNMAYVKIQKC